TINAWSALSKGDFEATINYTDKCIELYKAEALKQQSLLRKFPGAGDVKNYDTLNNVAACLFIKGEAHFQKNMYVEALPYYQEVIGKYGFAQYWDPKGWYWKVAEKSQAVIDKIDTLTKPKIKKSEEEKISLVVGLNFPIYDEGSDDIVDYTKYGELQNAGTSEYKYRIIDKKGLSKAVGEGIYPNSSAYRDPLYKSYVEKGLLDGSHWDYVNSDNLQANFYKWATAGEDPGVKLYYTAHALERARHYKHAIKAYHAIIVHYPKTISWTYWKTPWYVSQVAIDKINYLTRKHPELGMKLVGADLIIENGFDSDIRNDVISVNPGSIVKATPEDLKIKRQDLSKLKVVKRIGGPKVELLQYENGHWQFRVDGEPIIVKSVAYSPTVVGQSPDKGTLKDWTFEDYDNNGRIDGPYDAWVDKNLNGRQDADEKPVGDFQLLKDMGTNAIRIYHHTHNENKAVYKALYDDYGIMVIMGDFLGAYATGSGAAWHDGTDFSHPVQQERMKDGVKKMIEEYKDEPYILMWLLGNETNYGVANNAKKDPESYYKFVNEVAKMIKELDPTRPVAICNGDTLFLDIFAKHCPDVDIYGANSYRGEQGFGIGIWKSVKRLCDKPVLITEYGCPAYQKAKPRELSEVDQAKYHQGEWEDMLYNSAGYGEGNSIGGVVFQWLDEWWKAYEPSIHDTHGLYTGPFPGGWVYEEWFGLAGQGNGTKSPFLRELRESYYLYKKMWNE
ncbi:MAG: hypothetical protein HQ575_06950, partial [Candidatus Omnitrophica bacterium]|nr:hypothetical protein [Candidatus Omnitrophota bacterium]